MSELNQPPERDRHEYSKRSLIYRLLAYVAFGLSLLSTHIANKFTVGSSARGVFLGVGALFLISTFCCFYADRWNRFQSERTSPRQRIPFSFSKALCIPICDGTPLDKDPFVLPQGFHWHFADELLLKFLILHATMHDRRPGIDTVDFYSNMSTRLQIDICPQTQGLKRATGHFPVKHDIVFGKIVRHRIDNELETSIKKRVTHHFFSMAAHPKEVE